MLYLYNCWYLNWIEYSLSHSKVNKIEAEDQSWLTFPVVSNNKTQVLTSFERAIGRIFCANCQIMLGGGFMIFVSSGRILITPTGFLMP
jgi:hypothetical protein